MTHRIAMISEHASPLGALGGVDSGGQNVYVAQLASHLAAEGWSVDVYTRRDDDSQPEVIGWRDGVRVINVPAGPPCFVRKEELLPFMPEFAAYMCERWQELGPYDLVHANFWMSGLVAADLKRALDVPFVVTFHALGRVRRIYQNGDDGFPDERFPIEDRIIAEADAVIAECPQDRDDLLQLYQADAIRISVIPCGFDPAELMPQSRDDARRRLGIATDEQVVLQLGRLVPRKGIDNVVRAVAILRDKHDIDARLLIVGGETDEPDPEATPEIGRLQSLAVNRGVADLVTFTGRRSRCELPDYYAAADVFVTTPWYEPFGMTPLEAMACARPVIGTDVGGIKHTVLHGETGYLVEPRQPEALAGRLAELLSDRAAADAMGRRGYQRAHENFTWRSVASSVAALYCDVIADTAHGAASSPQRNAVQRSFAQAEQTLRLSRQALEPTVVEAAGVISDSLEHGGRVLVCGNGGSAADSQHFAAELMGRFQAKGRRALPVISLTTDTAFLTAWSNDVSYDDVFSRQTEGLGEPGDVLIGFSTSGRSVNVLRSFAAARERGMRSIALTGGDGGLLATQADVALIVPSSDTQRIQEVHGVLIHVLCELVEASVLEQDAAASARAEPVPVVTAGHRPTPASSRRRAVVRA